MRETAIVTISLPNTLVKKTAQMAKKQSMTRSELFRQAIREYLEFQELKRAEEIYEKERAAGALKELTPRTLARLLQ